MIKLHAKHYLMVIGTTLSVLFIILAVVLGIIYYKSLVFENDIFQIYKTDIIVFSDVADTIDGEGQTRMSFSNSERKIICDFLKQLQVEKEYKEPQQNFGMPPFLSIYSRYYTADFKLYSSHAVECSITYNDKAAGGESSHYYDFTVPEENFKQIIRLLDSD